MSRNQFDYLDAPRLFDFIHLQWFGDADGGDGGDGGSSGDGGGTGGTDGDMGDGESTGGGDGGGWGGDGGTGGTDGGMGEPSGGDPSFGGGSGYGATEGQGSPPGANEPGGADDPFGAGTSTPAEAAAGGEPASTGGDGGDGGGGPSGPVAPAAPAATPAHVETEEEKAARLADMTQAGVVNSAMGAARAAGLSPSQAAFMGAQSGSSAYQGAFPSLYSTLRGQDLNYDLGKYQADRGYETSKAERDAQNFRAGAGGIGGFFSGIASMLFSDKNMKYDIQDGPGMLEHVVKNVPAKYYKYKGDSTERAGIMAQDLEKTPLKGAVVDTPAGKAIDTRQLTTANTGMISTLGKKLDEVVDYLKKRPA